MSKFKVGDHICWRRTGEKAIVHGIDAKGKIILSPNKTLAWSAFFFEHVIEPNLIMKDIIDMKLYFSLINDGIRECESKLPTKAYETDAGFDLYTTNTMFISPGQIVKIPTGVVCAIPPGHYGQVSDRSSMGLKGAKCLAGVIDAGYRGEIAVIMTNVGKDDLWIKPGDKIAQLIIHKLYSGEIEAVSVNDLPSAERQANGFGSSGK